MSSKIQPPYPLFHDVDGRPLDAGYIYIGEAGKNPEVYPIPVFWDEALTVPAEQPIRTRNGYFAKNGRAGKIYVSNAECSITVKNRKRHVVYTDLFSDMFAPQKGAYKSVETIDDLPKNAKDGDEVYVKGYYKPTNLALAQPYKGGGTRIYVASRKAENDGFSCINGWVLNLETNIVSTDMAGLRDGESCVKAIRACMLYLKNSGGGELIIEDGNYRLDEASLISDPITTQSRWRYWFEAYTGVTVRGSRNAVLKVDNNVIDADANKMYAKGYQVFVDIPAHMRNESSYSFKLQGFTIDGNSANNKVAAMNAYNTQAQCNFVMLYRTFNITIEDMSFKNNGGWQPICINELCHGLKIRNNAFSEMGTVNGNSLLFDHSTLYITASDYEISNNTFINTDYDMKSTAVEIHGTNGVVYGNHIQNYNQAFIRSAMIADSHDVRVFENTAVGVIGGFDLWVANSWKLIASFNSNRITFRSGEICHVTNTAAGISDSATGYVEYYTSGNTYMNNGSTDVLVGGKVDSFTSKGNVFYNFRGGYQVGSATWRKSSLYILDDTFIGAAPQNIFRIFNWRGMTEESINLDLKADMQAQDSPTVAINADGLPSLKLNANINVQSDNSVEPYIGPWDGVNMRVDLTCAYNRKNITTQLSAPNIYGIINSVTTSDYYEKLKGQNHFLSRRYLSSMPFAPQASGDKKGDIVFNTSYANNIGWLCTADSPNINSVGAWKSYGAIV